MADKKDAKIIPFPKQKRRVQENGVKPSDKTQKLQTSSKDPWVSNKQNMFFTVFGVMLIVSLVYNQVSFKNQPDSERGLASEGRGNASNELDRKMAKRLAELSANEKVIAGRKPSSIDDFAFGTLGGKYSIQFENGKVKQLLFVGNNTNDPLNLIDPAADRAALVEDHANFLRENQSMFSIQFERAQEDADRKVATQGFEKKYSLYEGSEVVGFAHFELDSDGRLIKLSFIRSK